MPTTTETIVEKLLELIRREPDALDPHAARIEGENTIGIEDPETGALWFVSVEEV